MVVFASGPGRRHQMHYSLISISTRYPQTYRGCLIRMINL